MVTIPYSEATTGTNQYVSAIITDSTGTKLVSYGKIADTSIDASGTADFMLPSNFDREGYMLKVFSIQVHKTGGLRRQHHGERFIHCICHRPGLCDR